MQASIERLRVGLLVGAGLLVVVTAVFLGYAKYRAKGFLTELPKKLGMDIRQETNAFTYSQTVKGKTVFTIHAAKALQHRDSTYTLHDVGIVLYGQGESNRTDRIYGREFTYDPNAGVIKATGEVHLDLQAPAAGDSQQKTDYASGKDLKGENGEKETAKDERLIHVKTSGLVFMRQLGVAATDQEIEFEYNGLTGHAKGADYNSDSGVLVLHSAVKVNGLQQGEPVLLTATHAELDRLNHQVALTQAAYAAVGGDGRQTAEARRVVVYLRQDGSAEKLDAEGAVTLMRADGSRIVSDRGEIHLNSQSQPLTGRMFGGVQYLASDPDHEAHGHAHEADAVFDDKSHLKSLGINGEVSFYERVHTSGKAPKTQIPSQVGWSERSFKGNRLHLDFSPDAAGRSQIRRATASESSTIRVSNPDSKAGGLVTSTISADQLTGYFAGVNNPALERLTGSGHTVLGQTNEAGLDQTSSGDALEVKFTPSSQGRSQMSSTETNGSGAPRPNEIATAVQQGNVTVTRKAAGKTSEAQHAAAAVATYDGSTRKMTLSGNVKMSQTDGVLWTDQVTIDQQSGDAVAEGSVKASYRQQNQAEEIHVLAMKAELRRAADQAIFYGGTRPARLWQGGSQVEAPVLEFTQAAGSESSGVRGRRLVARDVRPRATASVHTVLADNRPTAGKSSRGAAGVIRVSSGEMVYSDDSRSAVFSGGVVIDTADGVMRGREAIAYLDRQQASMPHGERVVASTGSLLGGGLDRVVVSGQITMEQTGRTAVGDKLVYTASDGMFTLTGDRTARPKVVDQIRGTITGEILRFHAGDNSVSVLSGEDDGVEQRVHTETQVKKQR